MGDVQRDGLTPHIIITPKNITPHIIVAHIIINPHIIVITPDIIAPSV